LEFELMKRRDFFAGAGTLAAGMAGLSPSLVLAQARAPQAGVDYVKLGTPVAVEAPTGKIEIIEFFGYWCPHCSAFEPALAQWITKLPKDIAFKRVPVAFRNDMVPLQRLFYALQTMGLVEKLHARVFAAIHGEKQNLMSDQAITDWVVKQGVDQAKFLEQFNSFSASTQVSRAKQLLLAYQVEGVPAIGVAGRYYTDGSLAKSMDRALEIADFLAADIRASSGAAQSAAAKPAPAKKAASAK